MAKLSTKDVARAIYASAKNKSGAELSITLEHAVQFLAKKNMLSKSAEILSHIERLHDVAERIVRAKVASKETLSRHSLDEIKHALKKRYKADEIALEPTEDKSLLGGIRIEARDEVLDLSLKNKLHQLQNHLLRT